MVHALNIAHHFILHSFSKMKLYFSIPLLMITNLVNKAMIFGTCTLILLQDPTPTGIANHYLKRMATSGSTSSNPKPNFTSMGRDVQKDLCIKSFDALHFKLAPKNTLIDVVDLDADKIINIFFVEEFYTDPEMTEQNSVTLEIEFHQNVYKKITAFPCFLPTNRWAIEDGSDPLHFFIIGSNNGTTHPGYGHFLGLVDNVTTFPDNVAGVDLNTTLEGVFQRGENLIRNPHYGIHRLGTFDRFRACSSVYVGFWSRNNSLDPRTQYFVHEGEDLWYASDIKEILDWNDYKSTASPVVKLIQVIPCAIATNEETNSPQFYLMADQSVPQSALVLTMESNFGTRIISRVKNVLGMESLD